MNRYIATILFVTISISANCQISVITNNALNITPTSAILNGNYDPKGNATQYEFRIWEANNIGSSISIVGGLPASTGSQFVTCSIVSLKPSTPYTYTLLVNQAGTIYFGNSVNFITACGAQSITTKAATEITSNSAILNGETLVNGGCIATYSFTLFQTTNGITQQFDYYGGSSYKVTGLMRNTTYSYRFNINSSGYVYQGNTMEFTTTCETPSIVTTKAATNIESRSAILQGSYDAGGCLTSYYYQYGKTTNYELSTPVISSTNTGIQNVSFYIEHLAPKSTYHYRLVVTQQGNSYYGNDITITTQNETDIIDLYGANINSFTATNITSTGFKAKWDAVEGAELYNVSWRVDGATYNTAPQATYTNELDITGLLPNTKYYFRVQTKRNGQLRNWSPSSLKGFTTLPSNQAPLVPNYISLPFGTHLNTPQSVILSWNSIDPEGDPLHFDLYMGSTQGTLTKLSTLTNNSYNYNTVVQGNYYWKVIAFDDQENTAEGPINYFTIGVYTPTYFQPSVPSNPIPESGSLWTSIHTTLSWKTNDPEGLNVKYELHLGTSSTNLNIVSTFSGTIHQITVPYNLLGNQIYYWKVIVRDPINSYKLIESPIWSFTTCEQNQSISFPLISAKIFGNIDFMPEASASSGLEISYSSSNSNVARIIDKRIQIVGAGDCIIYADQYGKAGYWSQAPQVSQSLTINRANQTIAFNSLPMKTFGDIDFALDASSTSNLDISYSSDDDKVATVVDGKVHIVGAGTCTIYADQAGNANYNAAPQVGQPLTVNKFVPEMSKFNFTSLPDISYQPTICINLNGSIPTSAVLSQPATISYNIQCVKTGGTTTTINASSTICGIQGFVGDVRIYAVITINNPNFQNITVGEVDAFVISKANQTITFPSFDPTYYNFANTYGNSDFDIIASVNSGVPITFSSDNTNVATIVNGKIHMVSAGTANITATALGNDNYNVATKTQSLTIYKSGQNITFNTLPEKTFGDSNFALTATSTSGLAVTFTSSNTNVATVKNGTVHIVGAGICTIKANQTGDSNYNQATEVSQTLTVNKATQTITLDAIANKTYGDVDFVLQATSSSNLAVNYSSSNLNVATVENGIVHIIGAGICSIHANQSGNENYHPASMESQQLTVAPKSINITATSNSKVYGEADPALTYQFDTNLLNGDYFTGTLSRTSGDNVGTYPIHLGTLSAGNNYSISFQSADFTITKKNLKIKPENQSKNYGQINPEITLSFDGFAYNDNKSVIDNLPTISCSATQNSNSGTYPIELSGGSDNNYDFALENGTLQINTILGTVNTIDFENLTTTGVTLKGEVTNHGGEENIERGFAINTSRNPTILNNKVAVGDGLGAFSETLSTLSPNTTYFFRAYATNSKGTVYGDEISINTLSTGITQLENPEITIYPNPTSGIVYFKDINPKSKVEIYNLKGALVQRVELVNNQINIMSLSKGTYIVKILSNDKTNTIKVVKE